MAEHRMKKKTKEFLKFSDVGIEKIDFRCFKEAINVEQMNVEKILTSHEFP